MPFPKKLSRREAVLLAVLALATMAVGTWWLRRPGDTPAERERVSNEPAPRPIPRIDLARLDAPRGDGEAGRRNLFAFGSAPAPVRPPAPAVLTVPPPAGPSVPGATLSAGGSPTLTPLNVRYIGSVENATGVKVAILVTDRQEVLVGQTGQVVANRYRIARIGIESVDVEDVGTGQSRRLPMRGGS